MTYTTPRGRSRHVVEVPILSDAELREQLGVARGSDPMTREGALALLARSEPLLTMYGLTPAGLDRVLASQTDDDTLLHPTPLIASWIRCQRYARVR